MGHGSSFSPEGEHSSGFKRSLDTQNVHEQSAVKLPQEIRGISQGGVVTEVHASLAWMFAIN
jgi:hypothetical protein